MKLRWVDRAFRFDTPVELFPVILERLRGAPARVEEKLRAFSPQVRTRPERQGAWSIQEHAGHLWDLDDLHAARLEDYLARAPVLRPADMENLRTREAGHNARPVEEILEGFRRHRGRFVARLEAWEESRLSDTAIHPRLKQPMRVMDMAYFVAEHDDHHLARMTEIARGLVQGSNFKVQG
jgi:uncharacterized damage-inducible protein DinB